MPLAVWKKFAGHAPLSPLRFISGVCGDAVPLLRDDDRAESQSCVTHAFRARVTDCRLDSHHAGHTDYIPGSIEEDDEMFPPAAGRHRAPKQAVPPQQVPVRLPAWPSKHHNLCSKHCTPDAEQHQLGNCH